MKIFQEGDKSKAVCDHCAALVTTTFLRRDLPFSDGSGTVKNVLVGACDACGRTVSIPAQSTPAISKARKEVAVSIEANLPAIYLDVLDYAVHTIDNHASTDFRRVLLTYFVHKAALEARAASKLKSAHAKAVTRFPETRGLPRRRLSMKIPFRIDTEVRKLGESTGLNTTELIKSVISRIQVDVLEQPKPGLIKELRALSAISA